MRASRAGVEGEDGGRCFGVSVRRCAVRGARCAVRGALGAAMAMSDDALREMGRRAAVLAAKFSPEQAGADLIQVYRWLLGEIPQPPCVRVD